MFKKEPRVKALSNLKNSDRKKLLNSLQKQLNIGNVTIPSDSQIKQTNFTTQHSMGTIYTNEINTPILFKSKHIDTLFPTVYSCWSNPDMLPLVLTHNLVIEHLYNGANLMIAGTLPPFDPRLIPGTLCGIVNYENPKVVIAVGIVKMNLPTFKKVLNETGIAVEVVHHFEDCLFPAFRVKLELPSAKTTTEAGEEGTVENDEAESVKLNVENPTGKEDTGLESSVNDLAVVLDKLSVEDIDYFITRALYYTLVVDDKVELPMGASNFISNHIMVNLPDVDHNEVNIKKSSWKKTTKFLKHFEKNGFLKLKGKDDNLVITSFNKDKAELKKFTPYKTGGNGTRSKNASSTSNDLDSKSNTFLLNLYKPINLGKDLMSQSNDTALKTYYTSQEVRDSITEYIKDKNLVDNKDKKMILLDDLLFKMVNIKKSQAAVAPRTIARSKIVEPILKNNFIEYFQLFKNSDTPVFKHPLKGALPRVKIITEMKIGRKIITRVSHFEVFQITPDELAADLRKLCSGSTTIGETLTSPKVAEVQVQGPHAQIIIDHLNKLGVPGKWIDFENKVKSKKRK